MPQKKSKEIKVCITSTGPGLDSLVDPRFGRCQYFLIIDEEGKLIKTIENTGTRAMRGAGITAAQIVANEKVSVVITGNIGPNAFIVLSQTGIEVYPGALGMSCKKAFEEFNQGQLTEAKAAVPPLRPVRGRSRRGRGRGRRR